MEQAPYGDRASYTVAIFDGSLWVVTGNTWLVVNDVWRLTLPKGGKDRP